LFAGFPILIWLLDAATMLWHISIKAKQCCQKMNDMSLYGTAGL